MTNKRTELFPENNEQKRKLRGFSRSNTVPPQSAQEQNVTTKKKAMTKKQKDQLDQPTIKRIIVLGPNPPSNQMQNVKGQDHLQRVTEEDGEESQVTNVPTGREQSPSLEYVENYVREDSDDEDNWVKKRGVKKEPGEENGEKKGKEQQKNLTGLVANPQIGKGEAHTFFYPSPFLHSFLYILSYSRYLYHYRQRYWVF